MMKLQTAVVCAWMAGSLLSAAPVTFTGTSGDLAASATFDVSNGNLIVTLTNTATVQPLVPSNVLTAVYFSYDGLNPTLTPLSALTPNGSTMCLGLACGAVPNGGNVGGEWAFAAGLGGGLTQEFGISSTGMNIFGSGNFNGPNLSGPDSVDGLQYGLVSANYNPANVQNGGMFGNELIKSSVAFTLAGFSGFDLSKISNVAFQYGTSISEPYVQSTPPTGGQVPEPATMAMLGGGLLSLALWRRRRS